MTSSPSRSQLPLSKLYLAVLSQCQGPWTEWAITVVGAFGLRVTARPQKPAWHGCHGYPMPRICAWNWISAVRRASCSGEVRLSMQGLGHLSVTCMSPQIAENCWLVTRATLGLCHCPERPIMAREQLAHPALGWPCSGSWDVLVELRRGDVTVPAAAS